MARGDNRTKDNQKAHITFSQLFLNQAKPLDTRFVVSKLDNLDTEIPVYQRYDGLMFYVEHIDTETSDGKQTITSGYYIFENDLTTPISLADHLRKTSGIIVLEFQNKNYETLLSKLNSLIKNTGCVVYISPLNICVIWTGTSWEYLSGYFMLSNIIEWSKIPNQFKHEKQTVFVDGNYYIVGKDKTINTFIITDKNDPELPNRFYLINGDLFVTDHESKLYKIANSQRLIVGYELLEGKNKIAHGLNHAYISANLWIYDIIDELVKESIDIDLQIIDENTINIPSRFKVKCDILIKTLQ